MLSQSHKWTVHSNHRFDSNEFSASATALFTQAVTQILSHILCTCRGRLWQQPGVSTKHYCLISKQLAPLLKLHTEHTATQSLWSFRITDTDKLLSLNLCEGLMVHSVKKMFACRIFCSYLIRYIRTALHEEKPLVSSFSFSGKKQLQYLRKV